MVTTEDYKKAVNYAKRRLSHHSDSEQDAKDMVQEALIKLWRKKDPDNKFLYRYIQDSIYALYEQRRASKRQTIEDVIVAVPETIEEQVEAQQQRDIVSSFIHSPEGLALPIEQRTALDLVAHVHEHVQTALVAMYGLSKPLANYHYHQAFKHLANYINREGVGA